VNGTRLGESKYIYDEALFDHVYNASWPIGNYTVYAKSDWTLAKSEVKDYTFRLYFEKAIDLTHKEFTGNQRDFNQYL
jgi:hypothetical protein